ncbi:unnamed protein product [Somion occarium]|uniref:Uncharacterized protein n=1 Tax=Somion occarium TaxID=3059160 RepID=A0ABP1DW52_9APHY
MPPLHSPWFLTIEEGTTETLRLTVSPTDNITSITPPSSMTPTEQPSTTSSIPEPPTVTTTTSITDPPATFPTTEPPSMPPPSSELPTMSPTVDPPTAQPPTTQSTPLPPTLFPTDLPLSTSTILSVTSNTPTTFLPTSLTPDHFSISATTLTLTPGSITSSSLLITPTGGNIISPVRPRTSLGTATLAAITLGIIVFLLATFCICAVLRRRKRRADMQGLTNPLIIDSSAGATWPSMSGAKEPLMGSQHEDTPQAQFRSTGVHTTDSQDGVDIQRFTYGTSHLERTPETDRTINSAYYDGPDSHAIIPHPRATLYSPNRSQIDNAPQRSTPSTWSPVSGATVRTLGRSMTLASLGTMSSHSNRSSITQPPCYKDTPASDEVRLAGGPIRRTTAGEVARDSAAR